MRRVRGRAWRVTAATGATDADPNPHLQGRGYDTVASVLASLGEALRAAGADPGPVASSGLAVAGLQAAAARSARALGRAAAAYEPPAEGRDTTFGELLASHAGGEEGREEEEIDTAATRRLAALAGAAGGDGDVVAAAGGLAPNERCPLSGKPVRERGEEGVRRRCLHPPPASPSLPAAANRRPGRRPHGLRVRAGVDPGPHHGAGRPHAARARPRRGHRARCGGRRPAPRGRGRARKKGGGERGGEAGVWGGWGRFARMK